MLKLIGLANTSASILIKANVEKIISKDGSLKPVLFKSKKTNLTKSKILHSQKIILTLKL